MGSKAKKSKLLPNQHYLFRERQDLTSMKQARLEMSHLVEGQLYGVLNGKLEPIFAYASTQDAYSSDLLECVGIGEFVGIDFHNGPLSIGLQNFLQKPENREYAKKFFPRKHKH